MDEYRIIITSDAEADLMELRNYISDVLLAKDTAKAYIQAVRKEIASLANMPARYKPVDEEPWHSLGIRKFIANNFYVYYRVDVTNMLVYVLNVIYARRDQLRALEQITAE